MNVSLIFDESGTPLKGHHFGLTLCVHAGTMINMLVEWFIFDESGTPLKGHHFGPTLCVWDVIIQVYFPIGVAMHVRSSDKATFPYIMP